MQNKKKLPKVILDYFDNKKAMVIDESESNRSSLVRALTELGVPHNNISSLKTLERAEQVLKQRRPHIILTELSYGERETLRLLREQKSLYRNDRDMLSCVVTSNATETSVAAAAEEEIDCYVVKPYSAQQLMLYVAKTAIGKMAPNPYKEKIEAGKVELGKGKLKEALNEFQEAVSMNEKPCMAHFYTATTFMEMNVLDRAKIEFERGLAHNELHFKCLMGYFDLLEKQLQYEEAYAVIKKISQHFPLSAHRIQQLIKMAVLTLNFADVLNYFEFFSELEDREPELIKSMSSGLMECGKYKIIEADVEGGMDAFNKAVGVSNRNKELIFEISHFLIESDLHDTAKEFLTKCPSSAQETEEYRNLLFTIESKDYNEGQIIEEGRRLIKEGKASLNTFLMTIDCLKKLNKSRAIEDLMFQALEKFPDSRAQIERHIEKEMEKVAA